MEDRKAINRRSYVKKIKKRINRKKFRSKKGVRKPKSIKDCIYNALDIVGEEILKNKGGDHVYEDRVSKYIDPRGKFVLLGLFDGHSGKSSSVYLSDNGLLPFIAIKLKKQPSSTKLLNDSFNEFDYIKLRNLVSGATATVLYVSKNQAIIANVGDSPAYSLRNPGSKESSCKINQLSTEHDFFNIRERNRILRVSSKPNVWEDQRVHGIIQASRGMGDFEIKKLEDNVFVSNPSITVVNKNQLKSIKYLMITSDGITDPFTEKYESRNMSNGYPSITDKQMLRNSLRNFKSVICENEKLKSPSELIKSVVNKAIELVNGKYQDDISIILLDVKEVMKYLN